MSNTRAQLLTQGRFAKKADAAIGRYRLGCVGSDADHVKVAAAVTDRPIGLSVDGCDAAEDSLAMQALAGAGIVKMSGTGTAGQYICPALTTGMARVVPATVGAYFCCGRLLEDAADEQEVVANFFDPIIVGAQAPNGQLITDPGYAAAPSSPVPGQRYINTVDHTLQEYVNGAWRTVSWVALMIGLFLGILLLTGQTVRAADVTPAKVVNATTGQMGSVGASDNAKFLGTIEVAGAATITGGISGMAIGTNVQAYDADLTTYAGITPSANIQSLLGSADYNTARTNLGLAIGTNVEAYDADLAALAGLTSAANAIPYFTGSGTAGVVSSSANVITFLGAANNAAMADIIAAAITEGDLTDSSVVTADIKDGEIVDADVNASAAIANTKLGLPAVRTVTQALTVSEFTDNTNATGYVDLSTQIPAQSIVIGWKINVTSGFAGDTTAIASVGVAGNLDAFSADTAQSVLAIAKVGSNALAAESYTTAATTVRLTVTGGADFTTIKTANTAACTITVYYVQTE